MTETAADTNARLAKFSRQYGFSEDAVRHLFEAVTQGGGDMAMFDHPEFHGPGQWMRGGLMMTTTPGDRVLNNAIESLCNRLSALLRAQHAPGQSGYRRISPEARAWDTSVSPRQRWWPHEWGDPVATGHTDDLAYAFFDDAARMAIRSGDQVDLYKTADHCITGIAQAQQGTSATLVFTTPFGELPLDELARCDDDRNNPAGNATATEHRSGEPAAAEQATPQSSMEILEAIEKLGALHREGVLTDDEFNAKKQALLNRL
ncbi:SHOCT domain-containing protein [Endozoicomonas sp. G2_2]|uniref:SHOCT domain-containing protein n=1 Tax=Endozoicomonas sp. G2_2 TaxID=2821092 RepID=UPI001ADA2067|nr:SHOCT domain-containing protein [Endozoicomonas sp. G2_2]MBO9471851.1 SHOCT domain-containing protein [Endozoicomonas sp. G2_2]